MGIDKIIWNIGLGRQKRVSRTPSKERTAGGFDMKKNRRLYGAAAVLLAAFMSVSAFDMSACAAYLQDTGGGWKQAVRTTRRHS